MMYKIGIVGYGVVGRGIHKLFKEDVIAIYDPNHPESMEKRDFKDCDLIVVSVPTNEKDDWSADVSILEESVDWIFRHAPNAIILIKSTTPPLVLKKLQDRYDSIVFSPEYMGESKYFTPPWKYPHPQNMESHTWQTFGGYPEHTSRCVDIFKRRMGVDTQFWQTDIVTAGLAKYIENSFFAMKVTFVNEWYDIAKELGVNWNELRELWLLDPRINRNHTLVFSEDRGYGGKCFPKDTRAIIREMLDLGYEPELMMAMDKVNQKMRGKNDNNTVET
jgi:UDPglucose 6-dehydrogenase